MFCTRETILVYGFHDCLKFILFFMNGKDDWIKNRVNYLSWIEGKGGLKDIQCIAQNAALFDALL